MMTPHHCLVESCWDEPRESCVDVPNKRCWSEPKELCKKYPEEKCWEVSCVNYSDFLFIFYLQTFHESCWDEPREHCTEKKIKVAKKWCVEHEKEEENAFDKIKNLF